MTTLLVPVLFLATIEITGSQELPGSQLHNLLNTPTPVIVFSSSSINASSGEVVLNAGTYGYERAFRQGDSLNVTCYSSLPTLWFVVQGGERSGPDFSQQDVLGEINVTHQTYFGGHGHSSNLYIENIKYDYTGLYVCTLAQDSKVNSSIYIFAKDLERPFTDHNYVDIPNYPNVLVLYLKTEFTIPCQTSFPDINVTFRCLCDDPKPLGPEQGVVFDPKRGVRIETVDKSFDGVFACETNVNGITYSRTFTLLLIDSVFPFTLKPALQPSADVHKYIGEDFLISCFVEVLVGIRPVITWFHSNTEVQESNRISITKVHKVDSGLNDFEEFRSDLLVRGVIPSDDGIYKCTAWNSPEDKGEVDINFFVHERAFVTLVAEEENITVTEGTESKVEFYIRFQAYTKPEFYWMKDATSIQKHNTKIISDTVNDGGIFLRVLYPDRHDAGIYTVIALVKDVNASLDVRLIVEYLPEVNITSSNGGSEFYLTDVEYKIICSFKSVPLTKRIDWFEQTCESPTNCSIQGNKWEPVSFISGLDLYPKLVNFKAVNQTVVSEMIVKDSVTGSYKFYKCQGHNTVGSGSATIPYVATDVKNGFETWVLDRYPFVGDTIKLYFKASIWKYSNLTVMNRTHVAQVDPGWDMDRTNITYVSENHGIKIVVTISPISKFDQYEFVCFGFDVHGRKIEHSLGKLKLTVRDIVLPHFLTERKMVFFEDNSFAYDCEVGGLPIPDVYWYKDSRRFDQNNITEGYKITDDGQRLRIHATDSSFDGLYACTAENRGGSAFRRFNFTYEESHRPSPSMSMSWTTIVIIVCCAIIATIIIIVMCLFCIKKRKKSVKPPNNLEQILMKRRQETEGNPYATC